MSKTYEKINRLAKIFNFSRYLEIGVRKGETFTLVTMPHKTAVDPFFDFNIEEHKTPLTSFFEETSDSFFNKFSQLCKKTPYASSFNSEFAFDIIFIDGLHTFEQSYRDFENSIQFSHEKTIWIIDDTIPSDPYSAYPNQAISYAYRTQAQLHGAPWHGDVYKTIFAIHDFHPEFSYCTHVDSGNPQTILWKTNAQERDKKFHSLEKIDTLSYFDFLDNAHIFIPIPEELMYEMIGLELMPDQYSAVNDYKKVQKQVKTKKQVKFGKQLLEANEELTRIKKENESQKNVDVLLAQVKKLTTQVEKLQTQISEEKARRRRIKNSFSWKITSPLRAFIKLFSNNSGV